MPAPAAGFRPTEVLSRLPLVLFCLALGVRLGYWHDLRQDPSNGFPLYHAVRGVPFSDAESYDFSAEELAAGHDVPPYWAARRPVYSYLLALLYTWTGASFTVALALNVVLGALAVPLVYLVVARCVGVPAGLATALWAAIDPELISSGMVVMTELVGFFFLVWHLWVLFRGLEAGRRDLAFSGVLFAVSNLTRTLTLFAAPGYLVGILLYRLRARLGWRAAARGSFWFAAGVGGVLLPFMFAQWLRYGIFTLQDTTASHFFAATSPDHEAWDASIEQMADNLGYTDTKSRYRFFMTKARENLVQHPDVFFHKLVKNIRPALARCANFLGHPVIPGWMDGLGALVLLGGMAGAGLGADRAGRGRLLLASVGATSLILGALFLGRGYHGEIALVLMGLSGARSLVFVRGDPSFLLTNLFVGTQLTFGVFAFFDYRFVIFPQWMLVGAYFGGLALAQRSLTGAFARLLSRSGEFRDPLDGSAIVAEIQRRYPSWQRPWSRRLRRALVVFLGLSVLKLGLARLFPAGTALPPFVPAEQGVKVLAFVDRSLPGALTDFESECVRAGVTHPYFLLLTQTLLDAHDGDLVLLAGLPTRYVHDFPKGEVTPNTWRQFQYRDYGRTVFYFNGQAIDREAFWHVMSVWPGPLPDIPEGEMVILVGRLNQVPIKYQENLLEVIAWIPWDPETGTIHYDRARLAMLPEHRRVQEEVKTRVARQGKDADG